MSIAIFLYRLFIGAYSALLPIVALFNTKAKLLLNGRRETWAKLQIVPSAPKERVWFHCASLGEFEQARPLIEAIKLAQPNTFIALSFFSPSGYEIQQKYNLADVVFYLPSDTAFNATRIIDALQPTAVYWVKYEYWYFILSALHQQKIPIYLVCSIFRKEQVFFKWWGQFFRKQLHFFKHIFVQDEASKNLLSSIHTTSIVAGDTRFDRVSAVAKAVKALPSIEQFCQQKNTMIAGSTWAIDIQLLANSLPKHFFDTHQLIIAPHNVNEKSIEQIEEQFLGKTIRYSAYQPNTTASVLIVDCTGLLSTLYRFGTFAYIGGGFGISVHNVLEAAVYGLPCIFGPHHTKAKEAIALVQQQGAITVEDSKQLRDAIQFLFDDDTRKRYAFVAAQYVQNNLGATARILDITRGK